MSDDPIAALQDQRAALWQAIAELEYCTDVHLPPDPGDGWRGPARDAYALLLGQLRHRVGDARGSLCEAHRLTVAALRVGASGG